MRIMVARVKAEGIQKTHDGIDSGFDWRKINEAALNPKRHNAVKYQ